MYSYKVLRFVVGAVLVCCTVAAQADTVQVLTNTDLLPDGGGWGFGTDAGYSYEDGRPHSAYLHDVSGSFVGNMTDHGIVAGEQFALTWDACYAAGSGSNATQTASLIYQDGTEYVTIASKTVDLGSVSQNWATFDDLSFIAETGAAYLGKPIGVSFTLGGSGSVWGGLDKVSLNCTSIPEPGTIILLATGVAGLVAYAWRRQK